MKNKRALDIVLDEFYKIAQIPRPSHHEGQISEYLYQWALGHGLKAEKDSMGNVIIDKPAAAGLENAPRTILQAHMDMVCVAEEGVAYNPLTDGIKVINDGEKLTAEGTSLGADNGIGVALCLYLLQDNTLRHGSLRVILTTNEEDGMDSIALDPKYLEGAYLINLDWETIGSLCDSCAGGDVCHFSRKADWEEVPAGCKTLTLQLDGLLGGHSGVSIHLGHANAIVSIATLLSLLEQNGIRFQIAAFSGGQAKNAIPASAAAEIVILEKDVEKCFRVIDDFQKEFSAAFGNTEKTTGLSAHLSEKTPQKVLSRETSRAAAGLVTVVPNNVHTMSPFHEGLVESSSNLGVFSIDDDMVRFTVFARSSVAYHATQIIAICRALAEYFNFAFSCSDHIPGWAVNPESKLKQIACAQYKKLTGEDMVIEPVHAGVECGAFAEKNPSLDMISIGPTLADVHTPKESCCIADIQTVAELLEGILAQTAVL